MSNEHCRWNRFTDCRPFARVDRHDPYDPYMVVDNWFVRSVQTMHGSPPPTCTLRITSTCFQSRSVRAGWLAPILVGPNRGKFPDQIDQWRLESAIASDTLCVEQWWANMNPFVHVVRMNCGQICTNDRDDTDCTWTNMMDRLCGSSRQEYGILSEDVCTQLMRTIFTIQSDCPFK